MTGPAAVGAVGSVGAVEAAPARAAGLPAAAAFAAVFAAAVWLGRSTAVDASGIGLVHPGAGIAALWFLARRGGAHRWADWGALAVLTGAITALTGTPPALAAALAAANVVQVAALVRAVAAWCPHLGARPPATVADLGLLLGAAGAASAAGAVLGTGAVWVATGAWSWVGAAVWVARGAVAVLLTLCAGPLLAAAVRAARSRGDRWARPAPWRVVELVAVVVAGALAHVLVFGALDSLPLVFVPVGLVVWVALRFDTTAVVLLALVATVAAVGLTLAGHGPFAHVADPGARALVVQAYAGLSAVIGLALALGRDEREELLRQVRAAAAEAERRGELAEAVLATAELGVVVADADGRLVQFNEVARTWHGLDADADLDPAEHAGTYDLFAADGRTPLRPSAVPLARVFREEFVRGVQIVIAPRGRRPVTVVCSGRLMRAADGTALGAVVAMQDVTAVRAREAALVEAHAELAERTEELLRSNGELEHFAGVAGHDLGSPLTVVSGYVQMIGEVHGEALGEEGRGWVAAALRGVDRMSALIDALLRHSRAGAVVCERRPTDTGEVLAQACDDLAAQVAAAGAVVRAPAPLPVVHADPVLLRQLLQNLVGNAVKYRDPDRACAVEVSAARTGEGWEFRVADNGRGIPEADRERVFEMFAQVGSPDGGGQGGPGGHGIGLATCQRIVRRHGGRVHAEETPGGGTTVVFTLPQRGPEAPAGAGAAAVRRAGALPVG
ncbi:sensor histidine kinase [Kineococcus sp. SYSU DK004]|uniref:sensor histidine kinase n=1 Tax=Kineococcus sp. SYSU DK004 TaxID=3383125 RepID=UPI003D7ECEF8